MSLEKILNKIEKDAEKEIEEINKKIEKERKKLLKKAKEKGEGKKEEIIKQGKKEAELEKQRILSSKNLETKSKILNKKDALISKVISEVSDRIVKDKSVYEDLLKKLIEDAEIEEYEVIVREEDRKFVEEYELAEESIEEPGVIVRKKDGSLTVDNRIKKLMERKKKDLRVGIAQILFESE